MQTRFCEPRQLEASVYIECVYRQYSTGVSAMRDGKLGPRVSGKAAARAIAVGDCSPRGVHRSLLSSGQALAYARCMPPQPDDAALMLRYADGDHAAFEMLYKRHKDGLYRYLLRLSNHSDTAADLYQEVWSKLIQARARYRPSARFTTYLYRIAHNAFIDHLRRNKRYGDGQADDPDLRESPVPEPDLAAEEIQTKTRFLHALQELPDVQRDAFLLHQEAGLTIDQIASVVGVPRETVKSRVRYANGKLRAALERKRPEKHEKGNVKSVP